MITIGLRAAPRSVTFAIYDSDQELILNIEEIKSPASFSSPEALKIIRSNLLDVLREFDVSKAGIRITEPTARSPSFERIQIEGVIQETFASSNMVAYFAGSISTIASKLELKRADIKPLIDGEAQYDLEGWADLSNVQREAALCAVGAVNA
jgi:hypothetical protein